MFKKFFKEMSVVKIGIIIAILGITIGLVFAVPPVTITNPDGSQKAKTVVSTVTMDATVTKYSTVESSNGYERLSFFVNYDETEHVGAVKTSSINTTGDLWAVNDTFTINGGTSNATFIVDDVADGAIGNYTAILQGLGYTVSDAQTIVALGDSAGANATIDILTIGAVLSEAVSLQISPDGTTYQAASFYDYAGGSTLQTSETLSADGNYYLWCNRDINSPFTRVKIVSTNSDASDTIVNTITAASH